MTFLMAAMLVGGLTGLDGTYQGSWSGQQKGQSEPLEGGSVQKAAAAGKSTMKVHYIDVGQGSAVLVQSGSHSMLIDGGDSDASSKVDRKSTRLNSSHRL